LKFDITYNLKYSESLVTLHNLHRLPLDQFFFFVLLFKHYFSSLCCKAYCTIAEFYECFFTYNINVYFVNNVCQSCKLRNQQYHSLKPPYFEFLVNLNFGIRLLGCDRIDNSHNLADIIRIDCGFGFYRIIIPLSEVGYSNDLHNLRQSCCTNRSESQGSYVFKCGETLVKIQFIYSKLIKWPKFINHHKLTSQLYSKHYHIIRLISKLFENKIIKL